ncbi:hypothetical protein QQ020_04840 [Fulvivirgaceae bacterium BMA12]|uniref:Uncharacterized protein n=1 Tax=Agaribacillus aureus TaxID=3051825 RepID=A0ABT8L0U5_9BACT|nr:hypothetical protein [Fulvivirgaceae bacterium BMA12]
MESGLQKLSLFVKDGEIIPMIEANNRMLLGIKHCDTVASGAMPYVLAMKRERELRNSTFAN